MGQEVTRVARIVLPDGTPVWARISGSPETPAPGELSYSDTGFGERVQAGVEGLTSLVTGVARSLAQPLRAVRPDEVSVQFGIEFTAKAGRIVGLLADGQTKAGLTVTLTWNGGPPDPNAPATAEAPGAPATPEVPATPTEPAVPATAEAPAVPPAPAAAAVPVAAPAMPAEPPAPPSPPVSPAPAVPASRSGGGKPGDAPRGAPHAGASPGAWVHDGGDGTAVGGGE